jgi:Cu/Ag efflux pump CusA
MVGIVKLALRRPYTFVVMALLIMIFGVASALRTPTDIFPNINIPVISVVFSYTGLSADDMAGRIVTFYERSLTTSVNDIEHIESQSIPNYGIIKIFFQPTVNINAALAEVSAMSQTVLKQMPAGITPPLILSFNASSVPILQLALSSDKLSETTLFDDASSFIRPQLASVAGAAIPLPYGGKVRQGPGRPQPAGAAYLRHLRERRRQRPVDPKPHHPGGDRENRQIRIHREFERFSPRDRGFQRSSDQDRQWNGHLHARRRIRA